MERTYFKEKEWKRKFGPGIWQDEPDFCKGIDFKSGYTYYVARSLVGSLCGYVHIPQTHFAFGKEYNHPLFNIIKVHGGITFSDQIDIDHEIYEGFNGEEWLIGFDCAHYHDIIPIMPIHRAHNYEVCSYKTISFTIEECRKLAEQLYALDQTKKSESNSSNSRPR